METYLANPSAAFLLGSLRGFPYTLDTALADIVDNSITAGAKQIGILADFNSGKPRIGVIDDGHGMSPEELRRAMTLGSKDPLAEREPNDLGRFGLGLKTASFSQCRRLTVLTSQSGEMHAARWDLDYVYRTDAWSVQVVSDMHTLPWQDQLPSNGTLVIWEDLDRVVEQDNINTAQNEFNRQVAESAKHLQLVFHRFIEGERDLPKVEISLNGSALTPFDPFNADNAATIKDQHEIVGVGGQSIEIRAFTLPHFSKVSASEWEHYEGRRGYLREQGFYLYRAGRLVVHGTWFGLLRQTEATKLARVKIDIPNGMDELWKIDVLKASAEPPFVVRERLRAIVHRLVRSSRRVYVNRGARLTNDDPYPLWLRRAVHEGIRYEVNLEHPSVRSVVDALDEAGQELIERLLNVIAGGLPIDALVVDLGENAHQVRGVDLSHQSLELFVSTMANQLLRTGMNWQEVVGYLKRSGQVADQWAVAEGLLTRMQGNPESALIPNQDGKR